MKTTKSRNSREGLYAGFRVLSLSDKFTRTGPRVFPGAEALRYKHMESEEVFDRCSHIEYCSECNGKGLLRYLDIVEPCPNPKCEEGQVWV